MNENHERIEEFKREIASMQIRTPSSESERWLLILGVALPVLGLIFVFAGYWGASGTGSLPEQFPYLISGGIMGLGLILVGIALFIRYSTTRFMRYWLVRLIYEQQAQTDRLVESVERLEQTLRKAARPREPAGS